MMIFSTYRLLSLVLFPHHSDIRSAESQTMSEEETEEHILDDMSSQMRWIDIMKPQMSMLKFRLSWKPGKTRYLAGDIYLPVWGPITTTESRLVCSGKRIAEGYLYSII